MNTSLFDIFKIGIGPSSSHTVGPMKAARDFVSSLLSCGLLASTRRIEVQLYGSLALAGKGHGTDRAVILGLCGEAPESVDPASIESRLAAVNAKKSLPLPDGYPLDFVPARDIVLRKEQQLEQHSNGMRFQAFDASGRQIKDQVYYSPGGGFIVKEGQAMSPTVMRRVRYPFRSAAELLSYGNHHGLAIWQIMLENEKAWRTERQIYSYIHQIWEAMQDCVRRGLRGEGVLPGGLNVRRRAAALVKQLESAGVSDALKAMDWVNAFAMAVNEENAAGGRVVTAPTNGAAGVVPAVAHYYDTFVKVSQEGLRRFFLTAAAIAVLYKENASISGTEVGCQGEVGVACSMAAAGLTAAMGGTNEQVEYAAEIGMEHNLGMTCDPIKGLVQIPCIERNAMGAIKAINASRIALREDGQHKVSLDQVIGTMYRTGLDMQSKYKETALGGLATLNIVEC
jgi:L-serine dehydratase